MKIALIQQKASEDIDLNISMGLKRVKEAADAGAKIICFAELAFTPFYPQKKADKTFLSLAETIPGKTTDLFSRIAEEKNVVIILNLFERRGGKAFDSSPVIDAGGKILGITRMIHITDYPCFHERGYYTPGDKGADIYETKFGKIGVAICYDRHYPEYMRALALNGAEIVFVPQAGAAGEWPDGLYEAELQVASFQNGYYSALCNRVGKEERLTFAGESFVCDPAGKIIAQAAEGTEEILFANIDTAEVYSSHAKKLFMRDRRPELYVSWLANTD